jgi:hypothetical protein
MLDPLLESYTTIYNEEVDNIDDQSDAEQIIINKLNVIIRNHRKTNWSNLLIYERDILPNLPEFEEFDDSEVDSYVYDIIGDIAEDYGYVNREDIADPQKLATLKSRWDIWIHDQGIPEPPSNSPYNETLEDGSVWDAIEKEFNTKISVHDKLIQTLAYDNVYTPIHNTSMIGEGDIHEYGFGIAEFLAKRNRFILVDFGTRNDHKDTDWYNTYYVDSHYIEEFLESIEDNEPNNYVTEEIEEHDPFDIIKESIEKVVLNVFRGIGDIVIFERDILPPIFDLEFDDLNVDITESDIEDMALEIANDVIDKVAVNDAFNFILREDVLGEYASDLDKMPSRSTIWIQKVLVAPYLEDEFQYDEELDGDIGYEMNYLFERQFIITMQDIDEVIENSLASHDDGDFTNIERIPNSAAFRKMSKSGFEDKVSKYVNKLSVSKCIDENFIFLDDNYVDIRFIEEFLDKEYPSGKYEDIPWAKHIYD